LKNTNWIQMHTTLLFNLCIELSISSYIGLCW